MNREEAIAIIRKEYLCVDRDCDIERSCGKCDLMMPSKEPILEAYKMAIKALEREQQKYTRPRHCDCCGVLLTKENNKCGYEICDKCNEGLERYIAEKENRRKMSEIPTGSESEVENEEVNRKS
jgi:hypothetical protein